METCCCYPQSCCYQHGAARGLLQVLLPPGAVAKVLRMGFVTGLVAVLVSEARAAMLLWEPAIPAPGCGEAACSNSPLQDAPCQPSSSSALHACWRLLLQHCCWGC